MKKLIAPLLLAMLLLGAAGAQAHGGVVVFDDNVNSYGLAILQSPQADNRTYLITLYLTEPDNGPEVTGATVHFKATGTAGDPIDTDLPAEPTSPGFYEKNIVFPSGGAWQGEVTVDGPRGSATANFPLSVADISPNLNLSIWAIALLPIILAAGVLLFFWIRTGREPFTEDGIVGRDDEEAEAGTTT